MKRHYVLVSFAALLLIALALPCPLLADTSHIRIVRLSLVQGDVRFVQSFHKDPMTDSSAVWERAPLNLPIRQGYALATDEGRAEVEFESGAMAFLNAHSVLEFYDLSLEDGSRITRLVLRQGTGTFYVNPAAGEYFSVTGGDFTVEANGRTEFRLDNFDDGSTVEVEKGHVSALLSDKPTPLEKGQSYTVHASDPKNPEIARLSDNDDFDSWVSGRIDTVVTATNYSSLYVNSPTYSSGFSDLYTYGSWYSLGGFGYGWRPFGAAFGWSPFSYGDWYLDPSFGWSFIGSAPWGWLPYHYGGWVFSPAYGWVWAPSGFGGGGPVAYRPVTAVFVHSGSTFGFVPAHPGDVRGKMPLNIEQGIYSTGTRGTMATVATPTSGEKWSVVKRAPVTALSGTTFAAASLPSRVVRTLPTATTSNRSEATSGGSSIVYDASSHRFVNSNVERAGSAAVAKSEAAPVAGRSGSPAAVVSASSTIRGTSAAPAAAPRSAAAYRPALTPPPARTSSGGFGAAHSSGAPAWGASPSSASMGAARSSSSSSSSASHSSGGSHH
jgi:hypothetical protein